MLFLVVLTVTLYVMILSPALVMSEPGQDLRHGKKLVLLTVFILLHAHYALTTLINNSWEYHEQKGREARGRETEHRDEKKKNAVL